MSETCSTNSSGRTVTIGYYLLYGIILSVECYLVSFRECSRGEGIVEVLLLLIGVIALLAFLAISLSRVKLLNRVVMLLVQNLFGVWSVVQYERASTIHVGCNDCPDVYPPDRSYFILVWLLGYGIMAYLVMTMIIKHYGKS